jgi:hypothetical protein
MNTLVIDCLTNGKKKKQISASWKPKILKSGKITRDQNLSLKCRNWSGNSISTLFSIFWGVKSKVQGQQDEDLKVAKRLETSRVDGAARAGLNTATRSDPGRCFRGLKVAPRRN